MAQKILGARSTDGALSGDMVEVQVDQVVLTRAFGKAMGEASGLKKAAPEVAVAYDGQCVTGPRSADATPDAFQINADMLSRGVLVARAGVGFAGPVHLERFASPARLCITDEPRLGGVGGVGMLSLVVPAPSLGRALREGKVLVRTPVSVHVLLAGRLRPFVCARDVSFELLRRGLAGVVRQVEDTRAAPVVLEFGGPSARLLSVGDRSVLAGLASQVGAASAVFLSDERTEVFLRDQRRSKAHRALAPDPGAPFEEVVNVDLGAVDPLLLDADGQVRAVRDLAGQPVSQALLGGDGGTTLRDLFAAALLLKSKRVPSWLDFLLAAPSRQMLEVLSAAGALTDLVATGARLIEPDARVVTGDLYPPPPSGVALRTCDPEPRIDGRRASVVASAETLAYAIATGEIGDPRAFKRPVRVTVPRALPTDDVLVARKAHRLGPPLPIRPPRREVVAPAPWDATQSMPLVDGLAARALNGNAAVAVLCSTLDEVRELSARASEIAPTVRAVLAPYIPRGLVGLFSAEGIVAIHVDAAAGKGLKAVRTIALPDLAEWPENAPIHVTVGTGKLPLMWLALGAEREWVASASRRAGAAPHRAPSDPALKVDTPPPVQAPGAKKKASVGKVGRP